MKQKQKIKLGQGSSYSFFLLIILLLFYFFLFSGCGIPVIPYLYPVSSIEKPLSVEAIFEFTNEINNTADYFLGYELYYKFYETDSEVTPEAESENIINTDIDKLEDKGVFRIYNENATLNSPDKPLIVVIPENKGIDFSISVGPFEYNEVYPDVSFLNSSFSIARSVVFNEPERLKGFVPEDFSPDDIDLPSDYDFISSKYLYLSLYVVSIGIDPDTFNYIYSKLAYLGAIELLIN